MDQALSSPVLEKRFGPLPADKRKRILGAESDVIETWLDRIFEATSVDAVLAERALH